MARDRFLFILIGVTAVAMVASLYLVFVYAPTERTMGIVQRIFYFHVPSAWVGFLAFLIAFIAGIAYLVRGNWRWDTIETASVEIGIAFSTIALVTGSLWARPTWNTWWTWDPRLTTTLILWIYYVSVLLLRRMVENKERQARFSAVLSIIGFVNVPIVFMTIRLWRTIHPVLFTSEGFAMESNMLVALLVSLLTFTLLYVCLLWLRVRQEHLHAEISRIKDQLLSAI